MNFNADLSLVDGCFRRNMFSGRPDPRNLRTKIEPCAPHSQSGRDPPKAESPLTGIRRDWHAVCT